MGSMRRRNAVLIRRILYSSTRQAARDESGELIRPVVEDVLTNAWRSCCKERSRESETIKVPDCLGVAFGEAGGSSASR